MITYSIFSFDSRTPTPSLNTLVPTVGTALIIIFSTPQTNTGRLLGSKLFVGVGLISYSAYLYHQPLFAFAKHRSIDEPSNLSIGVLVVASFCLAYLSWRFVEAPFRRSGLISRSQVIWLTSFSIVVMLTVGVVGIYNQGFRNRLPPNLIWDSLGAKLDANGDICQLRPVDGFYGVNACKFGSKTSKKSVILYGDSHADAISEQLNNEFIKLDIAGIKVETRDCSVVPGVVVTKDSLDKKKIDCNKSFLSLLYYIKSQRADVIVSSRWSFKLYPVEGFIEQMPYQNSEGGKEAENYREYAVLKNGKLDLSAKAKSDAVRHLIEGLLTTNQRIFLIYPVPEIAWNIAKKNWVYYKQKNETLGEISIPYEDFKLRNRFVIDIFDSFSNRENFHSVRPSEVFCDTFLMNRCVAQYDSDPYYYDDDHLSDSGAKLVVKEILKILIN